MIVSKICGYDALLNALLTTVPTLNPEFIREADHRWMIDQRQTQRKQLMLQVVASGSVQCVLLDVSRDGARFESDRRLPERFYVLLKPDLKRWCRVIWRRGNQVGVRFIPDPGLPAPVTQV